MGGATTEGSGETASEESGSSSGETTGGSETGDEETTGTEETTGDDGSPTCDDNTRNGDETDVDCGGSCQPCDAGSSCMDSLDCITSFCKNEVCGHPGSCAEVLSVNPDASDGHYLIDAPDDAGPFEVACDMTSDGGGWTLIGNIVNDGVRNWDSYDVFVDYSVFGALADALAPMDYKSAAWAAVPVDDLMLRTEEYAVAWSGLLGGSSFGSWIAGEYDPDGCSTVFIGGLPTYDENLSSSEAKLFEVAVRPLDTNGACFPDGNENTIVGTVFLSNWVYGIGNTPNGNDEWESHDNSMPALDSLSVTSCDGGYPCNPEGVIYNGTTCYDPSCKTEQTQVWVR